jgi:hypothetical protein
MNQYSKDEFEIDLAERSVTHTGSGIRFSFYEYENENDWRESDSVIYRENPNWDGNRRELAAAAKEAAIAGGMTARRPISR